MVWFPWGFLRTRNHWSGYWFFSTSFRTSVVLQPTKASGLWLFFAGGSHAYIVKENYFKITPANQRFKSITGHKKNILPILGFLFFPRQDIKPLLSVSRLSAGYCCSRLLLQPVLTSPNPCTWLNVVRVPLMWWCLPPYKGALGSFNTSDQDRIWGRSQG